MDVVDGVLKYWPLIAALGAFVIWLTRISVVLADVAKTSRERLNKVETRVDDVEKDVADQRAKVVDRLGSIEGKLNALLSVRARR